MAQSSTHRLLGVPDPIAFGDLRDREQSERKKLEARLLLLKDMGKRKRSLTPEEKAEHEEIQNKLLTDDIVDPLYKAVQAGLARTVGVQNAVGDHKNGLLPSQQAWEALHSVLASARGGMLTTATLNWPAVVDLAGLAQFDRAGRLAASLPSAVALPTDLLTELAGKFDDYAARVGKSVKKNASKTQRDALAAEIATLTPQEANAFGTELAAAVTQDFVAGAESLVDWLQALVEINSRTGTNAQPNVQINRRGFPSDLTDAEKALAAVYGMLEADKDEAPTHHLNGNKSVFDPDDVRRNQKFGKALSSALGEYRTNQELFEAVLPILVRLGGEKPTDEVSALEWARVVRNLIRRGVTDPTLEVQLGRRVDEALDTIQNVGDNLPSDISIDLPDLEEDTTTDHDIVADNITALQPAYFAAMFEDLKAFQVVDKLLELFQNGILPIGRGDAGDSLFKYWKETATRVSEPERRSFYARTLGFVGGDDGGMPNREFNDLWMRFVSAVSAFVRQNTVDDLLQAKYPGAVSQQQVRKSGRDLAANLSLHGYGMAYFMATELQKQVKDVIKLLSDPDIKNAYGARDMWQVIDQVAALELGGAKNSVRYRTMAASGAIVIAWLAKHAKALSSTGFGPILDIDEIRNPSPRRNGAKATTDPSDFDLVNACEQWLAVTGTQEQQVDDFAQAKESPNMPSKPLQIPAIAREMLESVDVPALGLGAGAYRRH